MGGDQHFPIWISENREIAKSNEMITIATLFRNIFNTRQRFIRLNNVERIILFLFLFVQLIFHVNSFSKLNLFIFKLHS